MVRYHVDELYGEEVVASVDTDAYNALGAVEAVTGKVVYPRAVQQQHWFRVIDEDGSIYEFSLDENLQVVDFAK
jgi:hypothetical protein